MGATKTTGGQLLAILSADIKKTDGDKALELVKRQIKTARINALAEIGKLDARVDSLRDEAERIAKNPNSTMMDIVTSERELQLAETNLNAAQEAFDNRF